MERGIRDGSHCDDLFWRGKKLGKVPSYDLRQGRGAYSFPRLVTDVLPKIALPIRADNEYTHFWTCAVEHKRQPVWRPRDSVERTITSDELDGRPNLPPKSSREYGFATCFDVEYNVNPCVNEETCRPECSSIRQRFLGSV